MKGRPHKNYKGHCMLCGAHTMRGQGRSKRDPWRVLRQLGKARRFTRKDLGA